MTGHRQTACLIDERGRVLEARPFSVPPTLDQGASQSPGCIKVAIASRTVHLAFDPGSVSPMAVGGLLYFLHDRGLHRHPGLMFCLSSGAGAGTNGSVVEIFPTLAQAVNRLQFLAEDRNPATHQRFTVDAIDLARARTHRNFARLLGCWRDHAGTFDTAAVMPLLRFDFADRYCLFEPAPERDDFRIVDAGGGLRIPDPHFPVRLPGSGLSGFPDFRYVSWLTETYNKVLRSNEPDYGDIAARIFWPGTGLVTRRYRRLLLPWSAAEGRRLLLSVNRPLKLSQRA